MPLDQVNRERVLILGGGVAALTAAWELSSTRALQRRFDVVVLPSAKDPPCSDTWYGFSDNAFALFEDVFEAWERPADSPWVEWSDAFRPVPPPQVVDAAERVRRLVGWRDDVQSPGSAGEHLEPGALLRTLVARLLSLVEFIADELVAAQGVPTPGGLRGVATRVVGGLAQRVDGLADRAIDGLDPKLLAQAERLRARRADLSERILALLGRLAGVPLRLQRRALQAVVAACRALIEIDERLDPDTDRLRSLLPLLARPLHAMMDLDLPPRPGAPMDHQGLRALLDLSLAFMAGLLNPEYELLAHDLDLDRLDHLEFRQWLIDNGADPVTTWEWGALSALYQDVFPTQDAQQTCAAGVAARVLIRLLLTGRGAPLWLTERGLQDTLLTPMQDVLKARGVRFETGWELRELLLDETGSHVEGIRIQSGDKAELVQRGLHFDTLALGLGLDCLAPRTAGSVAPIQALIDHVDGWRALVEAPRLAPGSVATAPGSTAARLRPDASGVGGLVLCGGWTNNGINAGCVEAEVIAGMVAAGVVVGRSRPIAALGFLSSFDEQLEVARDQRRWGAGRYQRRVDDPALVFPLLNKDCELNLALLRGDERKIQTYLDSWFLAGTDGQVRACSFNDTVMVAFHTGDVGSEDRRPWNYSPAGRIDHAGSSLFVPTVLLHAAASDGVPRVVVRGPAWDLSYDFTDSFQAVCAARYTCGISRSLATTRQVSRSSGDYDLDLVTRAQLLREASPDCEWKEGTVYHLARRRGVQAMPLEDNPVDAIDRHFSAVIAGRPDGHLRVIIDCFGGAVWAEEPDLGLTQALLDRLPRVQPGQAVGPNGPEAAPTSLGNGSGTLVGQDGDDALRARLRAGDIDGLCLLSVPIGPFLTLPDTQVIGLRQVASVHDPEKAALRQLVRVQMAYNNVRSVQLYPERSWRFFATTDAASHPIRTELGLDYSDTLASVQLRADVRSVPLGVEWSVRQSQV